jgi:hypothetical protein
MITNELKLRVEEELKGVSESPGGFYIDSYIRCENIKSIVNCFLEVKQFIRHQNVCFYIKMPLRFSEEYDYKIIENQEVLKNLNKHVDYQDAKFVFYDIHAQSIKQTTSLLKEFKSTFISPALLDFDNFVDIQFEYWESLDEFNEYTRELVVLDTSLTRLR